MWNLGFPEIVIIFIVALVIFGPRKLPELGRSLGRGLSEFKRASNELKRTWVTPMVVLYLISIAISWIFKRRRQRTEKGTE